MAAARGAPLRRGAASRERGEYRREFCALCGVQWVGAAGVSQWSSPVESAEQQGVRVADAVGHATDDRFGVDPGPYFHQPRRPGSYR